MSLTLRSKKFQKLELTTLACERLNCQLLVDSLIFINQSTLHQ